MNDQPISLAFDLIRRYAERERWIPIGRKDWRVGLWRIRVNGQADAWDDIPAWHALIEHTEIVAMMLIHPYHGSALGWKDTEADFITAMQQELGDA